MPEAYLMLGDLARAEEHLAALRGSACCREELADLRRDYGVSQEDRQRRS
jgi:hypothetical protein